MVELIIEKEYEYEVLTASQLSELKAVCEKVMEIEECDFDAQISLTFTDNAGIKEINEQYRNIASPTDVLSFPMLEFDENGEFDADYEMEDDMVVLGDIVISVERAMEQAKELNHSIRRELAFLTAHSMLHLLGYDHVDDAEGEKYMIEKQNETLTALGISRDAV